MQATDNTGTSRRITTLVIAASMLIASIALAGTPRPPSCLSFDGFPTDPGASCGDPTPTVYNDQDGPLGDGTVIGDLTVTGSTFHSIGVVWDIDGDANHNAEVTVRYRKVGHPTFSDALPLIRSDYQWFWIDYYPPTHDNINIFAGSIMFLTPGTDYECVFELVDPDGGRAIRVETITTRAIPVKPNGGNTYYVVPGSGGGDGSSGNPFQGIDAATAAAAPGDRIFLRSGSYPKAVLNAYGAENNYIVYEEDPGDPGAVVDAFEIRADHVWIDGLKFVWNDPTGGSTPIRDQLEEDTSAIYRAWTDYKNGGHIPDDVIITGNTMTGFLTGVQTGYPITRWVVMDNDITGFLAPGIGSDPTPPTLGSTGKGINVGGESQWARSAGQNPEWDVANLPLWRQPPQNVVAFNRITLHTDAIGAYEDCDVYGNEIFDIAGNAVSMDGGYANTRVWGNIISDVQGSPITLQPQRIGPWYWLYNQFSDTVRGVYKIRTSDRNVFINNTVLQGSIGKAGAFLKWYMRNNLLIATNNNAGVWAQGSGDSPPAYNVPMFTADWRTDLDYDGFGVGNTGTIFKWDEVSYTSIPTWSAAVGGGTEANGVEVDPDLIFDDYTIDPINPMILAAGTNAAVGAGAVVPNLSDWHGGAPDLGAHQRGAAPLHYGPRTAELDLPLHQRTLHWNKH